MEQLNMFVERSPEEYEALEAEVARLRFSRDYWFKVATGYEDRMAEIEQAYCEEFGISPQQLLEDVG